VTTLTKRMSEDLTEYFTEVGCAFAIFIRTLRRSSASRSCAICDAGSLMCW